MKLLNVQRTFLFSNNYLKVICHNSFKLKNDDIYPIQDIQGLLSNEYINLENAKKLFKDWDDSIDETPEGRKMSLKEKTSSYQ